MTRAFIVLATTVWLASCQSTPKLQVRADLSLPYREMPGRSPVVVVGKVMAVKVVGPEVRTSDENHYPLRLRHITIDVENVLKGAAHAGRIVFYRYDWSPDHAMLGPWGIVTPGQRHVFFLDREGGVLRSMIDLYPSNMEVRSGRHPGFNLTPGQSLVDGIACLLLTLGRDVQPEAFAAGLLVVSSLSLDVSGRATTLKLLKALSAAKEPPLREQACIVLADRFYGQAQCLSTLLANREVSQRTRLLAEQAFQQELRRQVVFTKLFWGDPLDWVRHEAGYPQGPEVLDVLQVMAQHSDVAVRRKACALIAQEFPANYTAACGQQPIR